MHWSSIAGIANRLKTIQIYFITVSVGQRSATVTPG